MLKRLLQRREAYRRVFQGPHADVVLADLKRFCRATAPTHTPGDPYTTAFLEGRREVFNRIQSFVHMDDARLHNLKEPTDD